MPLGKRGPQTWIINPISDDIYEPTEALTLNIEQSENVRIAEPAIALNLKDDNILPEIILAEVQAVEGGEENFLRFQLSGPSSRPASFFCDLIN